MPAGRTYTIADIASDAHYLARDMLQRVTAQDVSPVSLPGIVPKLSRTPGAHRHSASLRVGQDTVSVLKVNQRPQALCAHVASHSQSAFSVLHLQDMGICEAQIEEMRHRGILVGG